MASVHEFVTAVDEYLAAPKRILGAVLPPAWREGREVGGDALILKLPLEINGEQNEYQKLLISAYPDADELMFSIGIMFQWAVCRIDYDQNWTHSNVGYGVGPEIPPIVVGPHYHPWRENRRLIRDMTRPFKLHIAVPLDVHIRQFDAALRWFCQQNNIELNEHRIELPPRTRLL